MANRNHNGGGRPGTSRSHASAKTKMGLSLSSRTEVQDDGGRVENEASDNEEEEEKPRRQLSPKKAEELEEFKKQLLKKREARRKIIAEKSREMQALRGQLEEERCLRAEAINQNKLLLAVIAENNLALPVNQEGTETPELVLKSSLVELENQVRSLKEHNKVLQCEIAECHSVNANVTKEASLLNRENIELKKHVQSLKDVNRVSKEMINIRECQLSQLKEKLGEIEKSLADRELRTLSDDLRSEYERQLENIRNLRILYEERARVAEVTRQNLARDLERQRTLTEFQEKKCGDLEIRVGELEKELSDKNDILGSKENQLGMSKAEARDLQAEMTVINQLFSQMLLGFNSNQDLDKLVMKLEENHDLLTDMVVREDCSEMSSALPKLILDLLNQMDYGEKENPEEKADECDGSNTAEETGNAAGKSLTSAEEIVGNLPKVWKVLMELLSHQAGPPIVISDITEKSTNSCYNSVETPHGIRLVPSVSKTYIRLKDLILEKNSLQKEMNRLKHLNGHLENRLQDQERRLGLVSSEVNKTWHIVGRMQRQHQQLHTHEQILRFELQQKRILLTKLKEELQYCKENWDKAKQKNSESQEEWNKLREEFSSRKIQSTDSVNNSAESGYSDEKPSDEDSDDSSGEKKTERKRLKKKNKAIVESSVDYDATVDSNVSDGEAVSRVSNDRTEENDDNQNVTGSSTDVSRRLSTDSAERSSTDPPSVSSTSKTSYDDVLAARSARLKKLEEQCYVLVHKVTKTNTKGVQLCNRLEELHNQYGGSEEDQSSSSQSSKQTSTSNKLENEEIPKLTLSEEQKLSNSAIVEGSECTIGENCDTNIDNIEEAKKDIGDEDHINLNKDIEVKVDGAPSTSTGKIDYEARFAARDVRLKRMEEQAKSLVDQVSNTSTRGEEISSKLTELHNTYGSKAEEEQSDESKEEDKTVLTAQCSADEQTTVTNLSNLTETKEETDVSENLKCDN